MGRLRIIVLLVFAASSAMAESPITPTRDSLSIAAFQQLNVVTTGDDQITTAKCYGALNQALLQVCRDFPAYEKIDTVTIDKTAEGGALANDFLRLKSVFRMKGDTLRVPLQVVDMDSLPGLSPRDSVAVQEKGNILSPRYAYTYANRLLTHPKYIISGSADSFLVCYYALDDKLTSATDSVSIDKTYLTALKYYACYSLLAMIQDYEGAMFWLGLYDKEVNSVGKARAMELRK